MADKRNISRPRRYVRLVILCTFASMFALTVGTGSLAYAIDVGPTALGIRVTNSANPAKATVTFDAMGGSAVASQEVLVGQKAFVPTQPTREGYMFDGWFVQQTGGTAYDFNAVVAGGFTLYAHWTALTYSVEFQANSAAGTMDKQAYTHDVAQALKANTFTRTGYDFLGWSEDSDAVSATYIDQQSITVSKNMTLYAIWKIKKYEVSFHTGEGSTVDSQMIDHGSTVTKPSPDPTRSGYRFDGWYTNVECTTEYDFATSVESTQTIYAKWTSQYTIAFDKNAGEGTMSPMTMTPGEAQNLIANGFDNPGYDFVGWNTLPDGTGTAYENQANVDFASTPAGDTVTLYAQWTLHIACDVPLTAVLTIDATGEVAAQDVMFSSSTVAPIKVTAVKSAMHDGALSVFDRATSAGAKVVLTPSEGTGSAVEVPLATTDDGVSTNFIIPQQQGLTPGTLTVGFGLSLPKGAQVSYLPNAVTDIAKISYVLADASL